jgi:hypothetical protein
LKLLKHFLEQDPSWSKKTVITAANILGLSVYQAYKWGYDRKNKKQTKFEPLFLKELENNKKILDKISQFEEEAQTKGNIDFNHQVDELISSNTKYKNLQDTRPEFPMSELNFLDNDRICNANSDSWASNCVQNNRNFASKVFAITKISRKRNSAQKFEDNISKDFLPHFERDQFNLSQNVKSQKTKDVEGSERQSETTEDKSSS